MKTNIQSAVRHSLLRSTMNVRGTIATAALTLALTAVPALAQTTIFSDGFEGAFPGSWVVGNNNANTVAKWGDNNAKAYTGTWSAFCSDNGNNSATTYTNNLNTYMQRQGVSLAGYSSATLTFKYWMNTEATYDTFQVNVRSQSGTWANLMTISGNQSASGWQTRTISLNGYAGQTGLIIGFDFVSDGSVIPSGVAGVWIDDVSLTATSASKPNLTPYQPAGYSDKIVVSKTTGTHTDSSPLTTADSLYVDWAVINNGAAATAARFTTEIYVDGVLKTSWGTDPPLNVNGYAYVDDYSIGTLSAGSHTIRIKTDSTGVIAESNETDNEYTKTITVTSTTGTINPTLANVAGSSYTPQSVRFVLYTSPSRQATGNPVSFTGVSAGTYLIEGYQTGSWWGEEFWQSQNVTVSAGQTVSPTLTRSYPYVSSVIISNVTSGGVIAPGQNINAGTQVRAYITVKNNVGGALNARVRLLFDRNQASAYDYDSGYSGAQSVPGGGGTSVFTFNFTPSAAGQYYDAYSVQTYVNTAYTQTDSDTWRQTFNAVATYPNLTPYQPAGYSDKIVVSKTTGTHTDSSPLYTTDTLYVDWAVLNNGAAATAARFTTELYVDGVLKTSWGTDPPLNVNGYAYVDDYSIGTLSAGSHTIRIKTDSTGVIAESNETTADNEYTKTITVNAVAAPNLTPFQPSGWSDKIVVSRTTGNNTDSTGLTIGDVLYVDWAVINNGNAAVGTLFYTELYLDGVLKQTWNTPAPLNVNYYANVLDYNLGTLSAGTHTLRIKTDSTGAIAESNESVSDNEYTKTFSVGSTSLPDFIITSISLSPSVPQPGQAYTAYVTVKNQGAVSGDGKWLDVWANQSASQSCGADGNTWTSVGVLTAGQSKTFTFSMTAPATGGSYPFRAFVDSACQTTESNDNNNQTTLTYSVVALGSLPDFVVTGISLSPATPALGQSFTANITVKNQGLAAGDGGWLDVWVNQSSTVSCGTDGNNWASIGILAAGQSKTFSVTLTAPASIGSYTLRAFADSYCQTPESNDSNNQTTSGYTVVSGGGVSDFVVSSISFNPATPVGGQPFTAQVTVKNQGAGLGNAGWLSVWVNQPSAQSCGANGDQNQSVGTLAAGQSVTKTFNLTAPASGAPWTFRAFADSGCQTSESNDGNNQTTVSYGSNPVQYPDFVITGVSISPTDVKPGATFTAYITVKNQGAGSGDGGWLDVWANKSTAASCGDSGEQFPTVGILAAGASKTITVSLTAGPAGLNTLLAFVDSSCQTIEGNDANNQFSYTYAPAIQVWNLVLACKYGVNPTADQWANLKKQFRQGANFLYDATDGQVRFGNIQMNGFGVEGIWAEVMLTTKDEAYSLSVPWLGYIVLGIDDPYYCAYDTIVHEYGHFKFGLGDEYTVYGYCFNVTHSHGVRIRVSQNDPEHTDLARSCAVCIMDNAWKSEFCVTSNHETDNDQEDSHHESCWNTIKSWNSSIIAPTGLPLPGPCSTVANDTIPLGENEGVAPFVTITGP